MEFNYALTRNRDLQTPISEDEIHTPRILQEGKNCWRIGSANRAAFLIDAQAYFSAVITALERAQKSIFIAGWQIDSRLRLNPDQEGGAPLLLGNFLHRLVERRRKLHIHVLVWDFAMIYALEREIIPLYFYPWRAHRRIHFHLDSFHPLGASHHQKMIVVDDALAFVGGMDLAECRWDTPEHAAFDARRMDSRSRPYRAYHDVQLMVDGEAAALVAEIFKQRWQTATQRRIRTKWRTPPGDVWPTGIASALQHVDVAIARTDPGYDGRAGAREVEALYLDSIRAAERFIYLENQYLTSASVGSALVERLNEEKGPEIIIVTQPETQGWLEEITMGVLRARLLKRLREADRFGRLRVYCPVIPNQDCCMSVHSKVTIVDDRFVRVGSSNLNNRSMGLDTECDLAIEAQGAPAEQAIGNFQDRLLAEHLGIPPEELAERRRSKPSLIRVIDEIRGGPRTLIEVDGVVTEWLDQMIPESAVLDPESPIRPDELIDQFLPEEDRRPAGTAFRRLALMLLLLAALAFTWRSTPLAQFLSPQTITDWVSVLRDSPIAPLYVLAGYVLGAFALVPVSLMIIATATAFDPVPSFLYALGGSLLSAMLTFGIGRIVGRKTVRRLTGRRLIRLRRQISRHGFLSVLTVRILPVAPFTVVNMVAGACQVHARDFFLGTLVGMAPGILAIEVLETQLGHTLRDPTLESFALLSSLSLFFALAAFVTYRRIAKKPLVKAT
jgi:phosphatidylserine/phosphatidylglycerophosphate/cardiolipin synthase-like enzyme/uncharacterized membrane protein YdjX (TVP38/TMEM64 family)